MKKRWHIFNVSRLAYLREQEPIVWTFSSEDSRHYTYLKASKTFWELRREYPEISLGVIKVRI
ncbi:MAG: hypothetical protein WC533_02205 [Candidatus Pacearchaeota archaeon]